MKKPKMLTFEEYFSKNGKLTEFAEHHGYDKKRYEDIFKEIFYGYYNKEFPDDEAYELYVKWFNKKFSKLGQAVK